VTAPTGPPSTRRALLGAAGATVLLAGCGGRDDDAGERTDTTGTDADVQVMDVLLGLEVAAGAAYAAAATRLAGRARETARLIAAHERAHADALRRAIRRIGLTPGAASGSSAEPPPLRDARSALAHLLDVEATSTAACLDALPKLSTPGLRATVAAILVDEARHEAVLRGLAGLPRLDSAPGGADPG